MSEQTEPSFGDVAIRIAEKVDEKSTSQIEWEIDEAMRSAFRQGRQHERHAVEALLPDSLNRPLADRLRIVLVALRRESSLAVALRMKLHEVAGPEVASSINIEEAEPSIEGGE